MADPVTTDEVLQHAEVMSTRLDIPARIVSLHRGSARGLDQYALRWGAFLLVYAPLAGFFNDVLGYRDDQNRTLPLNPDRTRDAAKRKHGVDLFTREWGVRTRTLRGNAGQRSDWECFVGPARLRNYLADMKRLRDVLAHGGDPYTTTNRSGARWHTQRGPSMRIMGVEGFLQACCDLADQTVLAYGGHLDDLPDWPQPQRTGLSKKRLPVLPLLP